MVTLWTHRANKGQKNRVHGVRWPSDIRVSPVATVSFCPLQAGVPLRWAFLGQFHPDWGVELLEVFGYAGLPSRAGMCTKATTAPNLPQGGTYDCRDHVRVPFGPPVFILVTQVIAHVNDVNRWSW